DDPFPDDWGIIGTFTEVGLVKRGVGAALFARTAEAARAARVRTIDATIRADNAGGIAFYSRLGFQDYHRLLARSLKNGTPVDRVRKRYEVPA
ncbi:MAG: GNAT family N-acetyltransferase, partial [Hyphomonadaceae bacterium]